MRRVYIRYSQEENMIENEYIKLCKGICIVTLIGLLWAVFMFAVGSFEGWLERRRERRKEREQ